VHEKESEQGSLLRAAERERVLAPPRFQRPENEELESLRRLRGSIVSPTPRKREHFVPRLPPVCAAFAAVAHGWRMHPPTPALAERCSSELAALQVHRRSAASQRAQIDESCVPRSQHDSSNTEEAQ